MWYSKVRCGYSSVSERCIEDGVVEDEVAAGVVVRCCVGKGVV